MRTGLKQQGNTEKYSESGFFNNFTKNSTRGFNNKFTDFNKTIEKKPSMSDHNSMDEKFGA